MQGHEEGEDVRVGAGHCGHRMGRCVGDQDKPLHASVFKRLPILSFGPVGRRGTRALQANDGGDVGGSGEANQGSQQSFWKAKSQALRIAFHKYLGVRAAEIVRFQSFGRNRFAGLQFFPAEAGDHFNGWTLDQDD